MTGLKEAQEIFFPTTRSGKDGRVPIPLLAELEKAAKKNGWNVTDVVSMVLDQYCRQDRLVASTDALKRAWIYGTIWHARRQKSERKLSLSRQAFASAIELLTRFIFAGLRFSGGRHVHENFEIRDIRQALIDQDAHITPLEPAISAAELRKRKR
jgi:hypothetical protein